MSPVPPSLPPPPVTLLDITRIQPHEVAFIEADLKYFQERYFKGEERSVLIASFAGIVVGILSSAVTVEKLDDLMWYAALPLLIGVGCLLMSIVASLIAVIPHAVYGGLTQLGREWTNRQRFLEAAQVLRKGGDLPEEDYRELVFRQTHSTPPTAELVLRVRLRQLLNFKEATTFRQIFRPSPRIC